MSIRDKYKASSVKAMNEAKEEEDGKINSGNRTDTLKLKDGANKLRFYPKHEGEKNFLFLRTVSWLPLPGKDGDIKRMPVNNSRVHAGTEFDVVNEFVKYCKIHLGGTGDSEDASKLKIVVDNQKGLLDSSSWLGYIDLITGEKKEYGLFEARKTIRDAINDETATEGEDDAIEVEPFTDPDTGTPVIITYNSKAKKAADYYKFKLSKHGALPLTDEEIEHHDKSTPLSQLPMVRFTFADFERQLEGLRNFDEEHELNLFDTEGFQEIVEKCREQYECGEKDEDEEDEKPKKDSKKSAPASKKSSSKKPADEEEEDEEDEEEEVEEVEEEEEGDEFDAMDRSALKKYKAANGLQLSIKTSMTDDDIRAAIREELALSAGEEEEEEMEEEEEEPAAKPKKKPLEKKEAPKKEAPKSSGKKESIDEIKARLLANKKKG